VPFAFSPLYPARAIGLVGRDQLIEHSIEDELYITGQVMEHMEREETAAHVLATHLLKRVLDGLNENLWPVTLD